MQMPLYIIGSFLLVLGLGTLVVQDPGKGLTFIVIIILVVAIVAFVVRAGDRAPHGPEDT